MRGRAVFTVVTTSLAGLVVGCGFSVTSGGGQVPSDATDASMPPGDVAPDVANPSNCVGSPGSVTGQICFSELPTTPITIATNTTINTASSAMCATNVVGANPDPSAYCVVAGSAITISLGATLTASGSRPLVLASTSAINIAGQLNAASTYAPNRVGAGSHPAACTPGGGPTGGGGGAGGSFGSQGGAGGSSRDPTGAGGSAAVTAIPTTLRGGCNGGPGAGANGGNGGRGGGAVALIATASITITGIVNASGAGGSGPSNETNGVIYGAGGGGSGGMIVFDAPSITGTGASIFANGGGGGEGSQFNVTGGPGNDPASPNQAASGGNGMADPYGGDGGNGAFGTTAASAGIGDEGTSYGGGAGGGGVGVIKRYQASSLPGTVSPPAS